MASAAKDDASAGFLRPQAAVIADLPLAERAGPI
jgi:hypothetical protein